MQLMIIRYAELCDYTMKRGVNLCILYREMVKMETAQLKKLTKCLIIIIMRLLANQEQLYQTEKRNYVEIQYRTKYVWGNNHVWVLYCE
jgi:hypothetical protein